MSEDKHTRLAYTDCYGNEYNTARSLSFLHSYLYYIAFNFLHPIILNLSRHWTAMGEISPLRAVLLGVGAQARAAPFLTVFVSLTILLVFTRIWTAFAKIRQQQNTSPSEKPIPILPYWIPYIGHAPSFAWSFDDLLAWGRSVILRAHIVFAPNTFIEIRPRMESSPFA